MPDPGMLDDYEKTGRMFSGSDAATEVRFGMFAAKGDAEGKRKLSAERRLDAYEDDFASVLRGRISATYTQANAEELCKVLDTTNNPLKRIVNEISTLYSRAPARRLADDGATRLYREVLKRAGDGVVMPRLNRLTNLLNTCLLYVRPCADSLTLRVILPQDCTVWPDPDDPTMPWMVEFVECDPAAPNAKPVHHQWDRRPGSAGYRRYDADGKLEVELVNPYFDASGRQIIPIIAFHREWPSWSFWDQTSGADLYELTIMVGMWETWINHLIRTDSIQQKWASGLIDSTGEQEGGPTSILSLRSPSGQGVSVGQFSSQSDWDGLGGQIKRKLENVLNNVGLVLPDTRTSGDPTSGFALTVRSEGLRKIQRAQIPSYERSEESLYRVVSAVWNFEVDNAQFPMIEGPKLPAISDAKPRVSFNTGETITTAEERSQEIDNAERRIKLGLASPVSVYMEMNPEATEEEARAAIEKNKADTASLAPKPPVVPVPGEVPGDEDDEQPEDPGEEADDEEMGMDAPPRR